MNKKFLTVGLAGALAVTAVVGGSLAYFTDTDQKDNTFTVGNVDITLTEPNWEGSGSLDAPEVYPGEALAKDPTVENTGANPCFVRIKVTGLNQFGEGNPIIYRTVDAYEAYSLGENWFLADDGYFYYYDADSDTHGVLAVGGKTDALFDQIVMPTGLTGNEETEPVTVTAEAVQAQGARPSWDAVQNMTVNQIANWFGECGMNE